MEAAEKRRQTEALFKAVNSRDFDSIAELVHPELEFRSLLAVAEGDVYIGVDGLRRWAQDVDETWAGFHVELVDFYDAGEDRAVVVLRLVGAAKASGVPLDARLGQVWTWRDGRPWLNVAYSDERDALDAVGLPRAG